jgi:D-Tyr-tRNAtyr deacylase
MYALFLERMGKLYKPEKIKGRSVHALKKRFHSFQQFTDGKFGAMMNVSLTNEVSGRGQTPRTY